MTETIIVSCVTCENNGYLSCPFHTGYTGWDDIHCSEYSSIKSADSDDNRVITILKEK